MIATNGSPPCIFSLQPEIGVSTSIALGLSLGAHEERDFEDGEHKIRPLENVRDREVYVLGSLYGDERLSVNDRLIRMTFFIGTLRDAGARRVTAITPYLCYTRKDCRTKPRDPVSTRYTAAVIEATGADRVLTMDVHNPAAYENAFRIPAIDLSAGPLLAEALVARLDDGEPVVVSPDIGGIKRAEAFRASFEEQFDRTAEHGFMEKYRSAGNVTGHRLVADVEGRTVILVDDMVSSGGTLVRAARACHEQGAKRVVAAVTHGVFASGAIEQLAASPLEMLLVTDTIPVPRPGHEADWSGLVVVESAPLLADAIRRLHESASLVDFRTL